MSDDLDKFGDEVNGHFGLICDLGKVGALFPDRAAPAGFKHTYACLKCGSQWAANEMIPCPVCQGQGVQ